jgi:SAM-dependent methyltransferase
MSGPGGTVCTSITDLRTILKVVRQSGVSSESNMEQMPTKHNPYLHELLWGLLKSHLPGKLLDIPSGPGYFARQAAGAGFDTVAAEIDETLHVFSDVSYKKVDMANELPFASQSFDYVVSIEGIEHIENQFLFLRECSRVLKKGGKLFLTTPNVSSLESRLHFFLTGFHDTPPRPIREDLPNLFMEHINLIPFHRLETYLRFASFEIETLATYRMRKGSLALFPLVYPYSLLKYFSVYSKYYRGKPDERYYWRIFKRYLSLEVLCGSHNVVVAWRK